MLDIFLLFFLLLLTLALGVEADRGRVLRLLPSVDKQDPILRALRILNMHSRTKPG
jgi:hypothetical protein